jgi:hypothetical protein
VNLVGRGPGGGNSQSTAELRLWLVRRGRYSACGRPANTLRAAHAAPLAAARLDVERAARATSQPVLPVSNDHARPAPSRRTWKWMKSQPVSSGVTDNHVRVAQPPDE